MINSSSNKIKVLIIDDSTVVRTVLKDIINHYDDLDVVGTVGNPTQALDLIKVFKPDVVTLDVEMPEIDGITLLGKIMQQAPLPVLMISHLTERGSKTTLKALELGAIDFVAKPKINVKEHLLAYADEIAEKIRIAFQARSKISNVSISKNRNSVVFPNIGKPSDKIILLGSSTGGTEAIHTFLKTLPADMPPILIAQHMPEVFTKPFAERMNGICEMTVKEAEDGERVQQGFVYIAPGHSHLLLKRNGFGYITALEKSEPVNRHRPSVDVLFKSGVPYANKILGIILTGMGRDGASGMLDLFKAGAYNFAQNEASCVVFGMPKEAIALGATQEICSIHDMSDRVIRKVKNIK